MRKFEGLAQVMVLMLITMVSTPVSVVAQSETMLYLVEFQATESGAPTTREQAAELLEQLIIPSLESLSKDGNILSGGIFVGARAGVFIVGAKSHDELTEFVRTLPAWGVWDWKVTPLESFDHRANLEKKVVQQFRAVKQ